MLGYHQKYKRFAIDILQFIYFSNEEFLLYLQGCYLFTSSNACK